MLFKTTPIGLCLERIGKSSFADFAMSQVWIDWGLRVHWVNYEWTQSWWHWQLTPSLPLPPPTQGPMGMAFSWRGCSLQTIPPVGRRSPLLRTRGYVILWGNRGGSVGSAFDSVPMCCRLESLPRTEHFGFPPVLRDWVIKGLGMSSLVYATGHIKDPVPLITKRRGLSLGGRFPPSFIHQVIIITGLNKCMFSPWRWP